MPKILKINCTEKRKGRICNNSLGYIQIDVPHITGFHCKNCKLYIEYEVNFFGEIIKKRIKKDKIINSLPEALAVLEIING